MILLLTHFAPTNRGGNQTCNNYIEKKTERKSIDRQTDRRKMRKLTKGGLTNHLPFVRYKAFGSIFPSTGSRVNVSVQREKTKWINVFQGLWGMGKWFIRKCFLLGRLWDKGLNTQHITKAGITNSTREKRSVRPSPIREIIRAPTISQKKLSRRRHFCLS